MGGCFQVKTGTGSSLISRTFNANWKKAFFLPSFKNQDLKTFPNSNFLLEKGKERRKSVSELKKKLFFTIYFKSANKLDLKTFPSSNILLKKGEGKKKK